MTETRTALFSELIRTLLRRYQELNLLVIACSAAVTAGFYIVLFMHEPLIAIALLVLTLTGTFSVVGHVSSPATRSVSIGYEMGAISIAVGALTYAGMVPG